MITDNVNILAFYNSIEQKNENKWWVDKKYNLVTPTNYLIPFQIPKKKNLNPITVFKIINTETGVEVDLLSECSNKGLDVYGHEDYDLMIYPSHIPLDDHYSGFHYILISDGVTTLYSDDFKFCEVKDLVCVEYWHCGDFVYPNGHFQYNLPYKNRVYFTTAIGKPTYEYEEIVSKRKGYKQFIEQTSFKLNKFVSICPEYLIDAMRLVRMHDYVEIKYKDVTYVVDEFIMNNPTWDKYGSLAEVVFEFKTDTVININGKGYEDCTILCTVPEISTKAILLEDSTQYNDREYTDKDGNTVYFEEGDYFIIIKPSGEYYLYYFNGTDLVATATITGASYYNHNDNSYWMGKLAGDGAFELRKPHITSIQNNLVQGITFSDANFVEVVAVVNNIEVVIASGTNLLLEGSGIPYEGTYEKLKIKSTNKKCYRFDDSDWFNLNPTGIGVMIVESTNVVG